MMPTKVTDLENFALRHIVRPYQSLLDLPEETYLSCPYTLDVLADMLEQDTEWAALVINRARLCKFYFPKYIQHRIVDVIRRGATDAT